MDILILLIGITAYLWVGRKVCQWAVNYIKTPMTPIEAASCTLVWPIIIIGLLLERFCKGIEVQDD